MKLYLLFLYPKTNPGLAAEEEISDEPENISDTFDIEPEIEESGGYSGLSQLTMFEENDYDYQMESFFTESSINQDICKAFNKRRKYGIINV